MAQKTRQVDDERRGCAACSSSYRTRSIALSVLLVLFYLRAGNGPHNYTEEGRMPMSTDEALIQLAREIGDAMHRFANSVAAQQSPVAAVAMAPVEDSG